MDKGQRSRGTSLQIVRSIHGLCHFHMHKFNVLLDAKSKLY